MRLGTLTTINSGAGDSAATPGAPGNFDNGGTADSTPVFNYQGTVNGDGTQGGVAGALGTTPPVLIVAPPVPASAPWALVALSAGLALLGLRRLQRRAF